MLALQLQIRRLQKQPVPILSATFYKKIYDILTPNMMAQEIDSHSHLKGSRLETGPGTAYPD
jgi:hypothetical protein